MKSSRDRGLIKKAIAVILGMTMAFGALMLPQSVANDFLTVNADHLRYIEKNNTYEYELVEIGGVKTATLYTVSTQFPVETVEIPSTVTYAGNEYPVTEIGHSFMKNDKVFKNVIFPDSVKNISYCVLEGSIAENITLPDGLESLGTEFAAKCPNLKSVKYDGTGIVGENMGSNIFNNSELSYLTNEKGAVCLGNWLIRYDPGTEAEELNISELKTEGVPLENIAASALCYHNSIKTLDLKNIKYIGSFNLYYFFDLTSINNTDSIENADGRMFENTPWFKESKNNGLVRLGTCLLYYKTDLPVIDLTSGELSGVNKVCTHALCDCKNAVVFSCSSDCVLDYECFYEAVDQNSLGGNPNDYLPEVPTYKIKTIIIDGTELNYSTKDSKADKWINQNYFNLRATAWLRDMAESKAKDLFKQLDIPYYGLFNDKAGTLSGTDEFYIALKIHDYLSTYEYDYGRENKSGIEAFLTGGKLNCSGYSELNCFLLECAGVNYLRLTSNLGTHDWNEIQIGGKWYESDAGWDAQSDHTYSWFALSSSKTAQKNSESHTVGGTSDTWHFYHEVDRVEAPNILGDIDGDDDRDKDDAYMLWAYIKGESDSIDEKKADINLDGIIDATDGVLLDNFVNGTAIDTANIPTDGLAPGFKAVFINGDDYDNFKYAFTDREGYITLPDDLFEAPEGMKISYDIGMAGQKVRISDPYTIINVKWIDGSAPDYSEPESSTSESSKPDSGSLPDSSKLDPSSSTTEISEPNKKQGVLGDVNNDNVIDIEDAVAIIQHINGMTPLKAEEEKRADVSKDNNIDIDDAVLLISYINGNSTF